ncbi:MAG: putative bifunctional diguanylate cyclase/phosphodiesterase [Planctomycetota bacterium]|jgi:diguanylate cyclase (GGDEF)-like protein
MRVSHHVSIILFVSIVGAIGLAIAVGMLLGGLERVARATGRTLDEHAEVQRLGADAHDLLAAVNTLNTRSPEESFAIIQRAAEAAYADLLVVQRTAADEEGIDGAVKALDATRNLLADRTRGIPHPDELERFRKSCAVYVKQLGTVESSAAVRSRRAGEALSHRRRIVMILLGVICLAYLAVIERVRHWTTHRLITPVQRLAEAAVQLREGRGVFAGLDQGSAEELNTLARVLASFVDTLNVKVRERTAQVERQKEYLEREVRVRRRAEEELRHAAFHDKLTGLCNRDLLVDRLERCIERSGHREEYDFAVLFVDIDRFKEVNDTLGHFVGDQLLIAIAERFGACLRESDGVTRLEGNTIARLGGDEFVVLLDGIRARGDANMVAERLLQTITTPFRIQGHEIKTTSSIGIAFQDSETDRAEDLLRNADTAMYYAKAGGKDRYEVFNKAMHNEATARLQRGKDLRDAIRNKEFEIAYQPIISLKSGRLAGFEALARWDNPERGVVSPVEFIADAEETGVIVQFGQWVLEEACKQLRTWHDDLKAEPSLAMSVNVSKRQVAELESVDLIKEILKNTGVAGSNLRLEITESAIMENPDSIAEVLRQLKALGVQVHMDDFGTGYSSLSYLHRFPLDVLKIDRAFMSTLSADNNYADVVHTVVAMAHTLKMQVTVEGVETQDQLVQLMALDCDYAQGYYFSEPVSPEAAGEIIKAEPDWLRSAA